MVISPNKWELDVQGYLNLCNITDATPRKQIRDFAYGVNELGLWNSMVCWPLRSSQNAGTGTTAYSLGGLGTFNGALVNGPTWGTSGISFTGNTQHVVANTAALNTDLTVLLCAGGNGSAFSGNFIQYAALQSNAGFVNNALLLGGDPSPTQIAAIFANSTGAPKTSQIVSGFSSSTDFQFITASAALGSLLNIKNLRSGAQSIAAAPAAGTATLNRFQINGRWNGSNSELGSVALTHSFAAVITPNISGAENAFYAIYKSTLGTGLGLP